MSFNEINLHERRMVLLAPTTIGAAVGATATTAKTDIGGANSLIVYGVFLYGAGGTDAIARVQTSIDGGLSWFDIMSFGFLQVAVSKVASISMNITSAVPTAVTDGTLAVNTVNQGLLGDRIRLKWVTTGTYTGATSLAVYAIAKE